MKKKDHIYPTKKKWLNGLNNLLKRVLGLFFLKKKSPIDKYSCQSYNDNDKDNCQSF